MKTVHTLAMLGLAVAASGCATVIRGTKQDFSIVSTPPGATATLSNGQSCVTPCALRLPRKEEFDVMFALDGYEAGGAHVSSGWSRGGTQTFIIGNIILGGLVGMGVDASNGATRDLTPNPLAVTLVPVAPAAPVVAAAPADAQGDAAPASATTETQTAQ